MAVKAAEQITITDMTDVKSFCRYYLLQSSTLAAPSKPTTNPPSSSWTTTEPSYTAGSTNSLYFVDLTVFSNDTFSYSDVSLSSSYEAAKTAYNKAVEAAKTATNYIDYSETDGLQVGKKQSGSWAGTRTQQTASVFNILGAAGEVLASYGASVIEFGKNSISSIIKFCDGKGWASYSNQTKTFNLQSNENMDIHSLEKCEVYSRFAVMDSKPYPNTKTAYKKAGIDTYTGGDDMTGFDTNDCEVRMTAEYKERENMDAEYVYTQSSVKVTPTSIDLQSDAVTVNGVKPGLTLLWENPSPSSNFGEKSITVADMSPFQFIMIEYLNSNDTGLHRTAIFTTGCDSTLSVAAQTSGGRRQVEYKNNTTLSFSSAAFQGTVNNKYAIPLKVYGLNLMF